MSLNIKCRLFIDLCQFNKFHINWLQANQCKHCNVWQAIWQLIDSLPRIKTLSLTVKMAPINLHWPTLSRDQVRHNETGALYSERLQMGKSVYDGITTPFKIGPPPTWKSTSTIPSSIPESTFAIPICLNLLIFYSGFFLKLHLAYLPNFFPFESEY